MTILINGQAESQIAVNDRGLQYGDGLFETIAIKDGQCQYWSAHMQRLLLGCEQLAIPAPDLATLQKEAEQLCVDKEQAILKIIITRGEGGRGYRYPDQIESNRIISIHPWPEYPAINIKQGIKLHLCTTSLSCQPLLAGIKHLNRLEQVLARNEWQDDAIAEGLMSDNSGYIIEGTMSNLFVVINGELLTPTIIDCGVKGVMRSTVMKLAQTMAITVTEQAMKLDDIIHADELFVCNSIIGIWPVRSIEGYNFVAPGKLTTQIMNGLT